ncbi:MAG: hypothetical protein M5U26_08455 [Planctomycetota bacterium]|nr:hypothetical protein [Planctomycetota bacterium]
MPTRDEIRQHALRRLRRLNAATRFLARPGLLAERVNLKLAKEGWLDRILAARFATGGASSGSPWPALKPSTVKQRARLGFAGTGPILVRSGTLQDAALEGKTEADAFGLTKKLKDRAAPRYVGAARPASGRRTGPPKRPTTSLGSGSGTRAGSAITPRR